MEKIKKFNENNENQEIISNFRKFDQMMEKVKSEIATKKIAGNELRDLGNFIGQTIYEYVNEDDDSFCTENFIGGFEHGIDSMKEPSKSKWHNF